MANWRAIFGGGGYALGGTPSPLEHMWSLAVEEQFYVVWPLIVFAVFHLARRRSERRRGRHSGARPGLGLLGFVVIAGAAASSVFMAVRHHDVNDVNRVYLGSDARAGSILVGAALAVLLAWRGPVRSRPARVALEVAAAAALAALVFAWATVEYPTPGLFEGGLVLCGLLAVVVIAAAAHPQVGPVGRLLAIPPLRGLGLISYGLYLWHWPVFVVLNPDRVGFGGWGLSAVPVLDGAGDRARRRTGSSSSPSAGAWCCTGGRPAWRPPWPPSPSSWPSWPRRPGRRRPPHPAPGAWPAPPPCPTARRRSRPPPPPPAPPAGRPSRPPVRANGDPAATTAPAASRCHPADPARSRRSSPARPRPPGATGS